MGGGARECPAACSPAPAFSPPFEVVAQYLNTPKAICCPLLGPSRNARGKPRSPGCHLHITPFSF
eukprot:scaffold9007_cov112-Isochrysis_galbana.AAC.5